MIAFCSSSLIQGLVKALFTSFQCVCGKAHWHEPVVLQCQVGDLGSCAGPLPLLHVTASSPVNTQNQTAPSPLSAVTVLLGCDRLLSIDPPQVPQCGGVSAPQCRGASQRTQHQSPGTSTDVTSLPSCPSVALNVWGRELTPYFALLAIVRNLRASFRKYSKARLELSYLSIEIWV